MHTFDLILLLVLVGAALFGFAKGVMWQIAWVAALVVSYVAAMQFGPAVAPYVGDQPYIAMLIVYLVSSLLIWIVYHRVREFIGRLKLREFDRQIGAILGLALGAVACLMITFFSLTLSDEEQQDAILASRGGDIAARALVRMKRVTPEEVHEFLCDKLPNEFHEIVHPDLDTDAEDSSPDEDHEDVATEPSAVGIRR